MQESSNGPNETVPLTSTESFTNLMVTNALSPLRVIEAFADLVPADGVIAAMSLLSRKRDRQ